MYYYDQGGFHDVTVLGKRFNIPLKFLFGVEQTIKLKIKW